MRIPLYQVDAFAEGPFTGNPAAVCPLDAWLPAETMQAIAAENNLSETAFFVPEGDGYRLRWFTPSAEVDLCGHATLASAFVVFRWLAPGARQRDLSDREGRAADGGARRRHARARFSVQAAAALSDVGSGGRRARQSLRRRCSRRAIISRCIERADDVAALSPDFAAVAALDRFAVIVTAPGRDGRRFRVALLRAGARASTRIR